MGHTYTNCMYHVIFSTKHRQRLIDSQVSGRLCPYFGGIIRDLGGQLLEVNAIEDHAHLFAILPPKHAVSEQVKQIKSGTSKWVHQTFENLQGFAWQEGYAAFSVSQSGVQQLRQYIQGQAEHHRRVSFEEEFTAFLDRHGIEYDPKYAFD